MGEKAEIKPESLLNLDDLLQCPVCYEIPSGQIFQCNEGHHVCGRCKMRLDVCPVCRALFFGTRNYAMEELIANFRNLRAFKLGNKAVTGSGSSDSSTPAKETTSGECENEANDDEEENNPIVTNEQVQRPPQACKGLFRCLCCKNGSGERLPSARLLNHLRYFHTPDLLEGRSDNGEFSHTWQFPTLPGKIVSAVRVSDMGIFFLTVEMNANSVYAWLTMAASPWVAHAFNYTVTICGSDREAIFSDCVWSVRSCEGSLKKRGNCLVVNEMDARAILLLATVSSKLSVRRTPPDQLAIQSQPRAVLRIANRSNHPNNDLEPFLQDLQNDVARLSRAFAMLGQEATALVRSEAQIRARIESSSSLLQSVTAGHTEDSSTAESETEPTFEQIILHDQALSRNARRRIRQRVRAALEPTPLVPPSAQVPYNGPMVPMLPPAQQYYNGTMPPMAPLAPEYYNGHMAPMPPPTQQCYNGVMPPMPPPTQQRYNETMPPMPPPTQQRYNGPMPLPTQQRYSGPMPPPTQRYNGPVPPPINRHNGSMPPMPPPTTNRHNGPVPPVLPVLPAALHSSNGHMPTWPQPAPRYNGFNASEGASAYAAVRPAEPAPPAPAPAPPPPQASGPSSSGPSQQQPPLENGARNKKKRRHRR